MHSNKKNAVQTQTILQFLKFLLVGVSNTLLSEAIYVILVLCGFNYLLSNFLGFTISVFNAYYWSSRYVFKESENGGKRIWWQVLLKTYAAYSWGFIVNFVLLFIEVDVLHIGNYMAGLADFFESINISMLDADKLGKLTAEGINLIITIPMNFVINKYWAYRQRGGD